MSKYFNLLNNGYKRVNNLLFLSDEAYDFYITTDIYIYYNSIMESFAAGDAGGESIEIIGSEPEDVNAWLLNQMEAYGYEANH